MFTVDVKQQCRLAAQCMKIIKSKSDKNVNKIQPWFDAECQMLRVQTLKALQRFRRLRTIESLRAYQLKTLRNPPLNCISIRLYLHVVIKLPNPGGDMCAKCSVKGIRNLLVVIGFE